MFPLRRAVIHVVNSLVASQCGCHTVSKPEDTKGFLLYLSLYFLFQLKAPALSKSETQLSSRNLPLPYVLFQYPPITLPPKCFSY